MMPRTMHAIPLTLAVAGTFALQTLAFAGRDGDPGDCAGMGAHLARAVSLDPRGADKSARPGPHQLACDIAFDDCSSVCPSPGSVFIADGAYNSLDQTNFFVDQSSPLPGVFQEDLRGGIVPGTYREISGEPGCAYRGLGYDGDYHRLWMGGWCCGALVLREAAIPYNLIAIYYIGWGAAGIAVDEANRRLWVSVNADPDMFLVYDISGGTLGALLGEWPVPWQTTSDGFDTGGMEYDEEAGQIVCVNMYSAFVAPTVLERFDDNFPDPPAGAGWCQLASTGYAWGIAIVGDGDATPGTFETYTHDIINYPAGCPYPVDTYGPQTQALTMRAEILNADEDRDGVADVRIGGQLLYRATISNTGATPIGYGVQHSFYVRSTCGGLNVPLRDGTLPGADRSFGPALRGTITPGEEKVHIYGITIPDNPRLLRSNPLVGALQAWDMGASAPQGVDCMEFTLKEAAEPPPGAAEPPPPRSGPEDLAAWAITELSGPPDLSPAWGGGPLQPDANLLGGALASTFSLSASYPNPFNPSTEISYTIPEGRDETDSGGSWRGLSVRLEVFNVRGETVATLVNERQMPGAYTVPWNATSDAGAVVTSGVYFYRLQAGTFSATRKMTLVK